MRPADFSIRCPARVALCRHCRSPILCVLPPHLLEAIAERGSTVQQRFAIRSLNLDFTFRSARQGVQESRRAERQARRLQRRVDLLGQLSGVLAAEKRRLISDAENLQRLPGSQARAEGDPPTGDVAVDEAYDYLGATWDLYYEEYQRNSLDDEGMRLDATVHFDQNYDNAFWDGRRMVFGDGDGEIFERFTKAVDVVGHELTHGVIEHEAGLIYWDQPGALNESIADVFGSLVKQHLLHQTADVADWLIGEGLFVPGAVDGVALRSLRAPGTAYGFPNPDPVLGSDPQPAHMRDYVRTFSDNRGVHINSGIPNHAFYLLATKLGGYAWEGAGLIWYRTLVSPFLRRGTKFTKFARLTAFTARQLFGPGSEEHEAVREAWSEVGISA